MIIIKIIIGIIILDIVFSGINEASGRRWRENRVINKYSDEAHKNSKLYWKEVNKLKKQRKHNQITQEEFMEIRKELDKKYKQGEYVKEHTQNMMDEIHKIGEDYDW